MQFVSSSQANGDVECTFPRLDMVEMDLRMAAMACLYRGCLSSAGLITVATSSYSYYTDLSMHLAFHDVARNSRMQRVFFLM